MCSSYSLLWPTSSYIESQPFIPFIWSIFFLIFSRAAMEMPHFSFLGQTSNVATRWWLVVAEKIVRSNLYCTTHSNSGRFSPKMLKFRTQFENLTFPLPSSLLKLLLSPPRFCPRRNRHHLTLIPIMQCCKNGHLTQGYAGHY